MSDSSNSLASASEVRTPDWLSAPGDGQIHGVLLLQEDGSATHVNPAMEILLAGTVDLARARQGLVNLEAYDAVSGRRLRGPEHPFAQAARGEAFSDREVRVRTMAAPNGQRWSVSAKPVVPRDAGDSDRVWVVVRPGGDELADATDAP